jgi:hypothetical protein
MTKKIIPNVRHALWGGVEYRLDAKIGCGECCLRTTCVVWTKDFVSMSDGCMLMVDGRPESCGWVEVKK